MTVESLKKECGGCAIGRILAGGGRGEYRNKGAGEQQSVAIYLDIETVAGTANQCNYPKLPNLEIVSTNDNL